MIKLSFNRGHGASFQIAERNWNISLFGHCEERETSPGEFDLIEVRPLLPFRREPVSRFRVANTAFILSTFG